jgi:hypothetical protein
MREMGRSGKSGGRTRMNTILTSFLANSAVFVLSLGVVAAVAAFAVQTVIGITAAQVQTAQYCHYWCTEYGQCFWVCD